ncbi:YceI family protein [Erythrobacter sp. GH1-10]|uniref:YceI family protein n=1 Tax=Erythrobacter sp. GH1-10 TaxID=3349334 RepID=UPI00387840E3
MKTVAIAAAFATAAVTGGIAAAPAIFAQDSAELPGAVDPSRVTAGTYALDPAHTLVSWEVDHFGFNDYFGLFGNITGTMTMDPANISDAEFEIMVPIAEVTVASEQLKDHLLRPGKDGADPDFFGPEPGMAKFTSTSVRQASDTTAVVSGMLEMNGKSGPVTMLVEFTGAGTNPFNNKETVGFHARATIDRTQWGVMYGQGLVGNEVDLTITAGFEKQ